LPANLPGETLKKLENTRISGVLIDIKPDRGSGSMRPTGGKPRRPKP
jgi:ATP-dependent RNA helicase DeaD